MENGVILWIIETAGVISIMWHCHFKEYLCPCRPSPVSPGWWCTAGHPTHLTRTSHSSWQYSDIGVRSLVLTTVRHRRSLARPDRFLLIVQFLNFFTLSFSPSSLSLSPHLPFLILPIFTFSFSPSLLSHSPHLCFLFLHIFTFSACSSLVVVVVAVCIYHLFCHKPSTVNHVYRAIYT